MIRWFAENGVAANLLAAITIVAGLSIASNIKHKGHVIPGLTHPQKIFGRLNKVIKFHQPMVMLYLAAQMKAQQTEFSEGFMLTCDALQFPSVQYVYKGFLQGVKKMIKIFEQRFAQTSAAREKE